MNKLKKILVVDDEIELRDTIKEYLESFDLETDVAENGREAFDKIKLNDYYLILSDIQMPIMNGYDLIRKCRLDLQKDFKIVIMSGHANNNEKVITQGANLFLPKPIDFDQLMNLIEN